ncbi:metallophosphoesterase [Sphingomonas sinipercae]|uniref:Metallophosphoesterase n=1 Tax=Sphingomonas sinipercae TaxID=2714944 RepID=A0A6G7ZMD6_9SPHN|nr:metallophosphoesterase [Sphingomonas sinipercae]QIL02141.1 metallophosphoesterase [Sphingomonas sinipercae]
MPRIIHLSDLHFGAHDDRIVAAVEEQVGAEQPDLVVISGDFTQRARTEQFQEACRFLDRLKGAGHEVLGVPGNHDIPLYDVLRRFLSPLTRYTRYVDDVLCPVHEMAGATVLGINTARSLTFKDGRVSHEQIDLIRKTFERTDSEAMRILVTHHPLFALQIGDEVTPAAGRSELALDAIGDAGVDLLLAGHNHHADVHDARDLVTRAGSALVVQAGTATSIRVREQPQSFNRIDIEPGTLTLTVLVWNGDRFEAEDAKRYRQQDGRWRMSEQDVPLEAAH